MTFLEYLTAPENFLAGFVSASGTSFDTDYPFSNLTEFPMAKTSRSNLGVTDVALNWDLFSPKTANLFVLGNHNLSESASIIFRGGSVNAPDGSQFQVTVPWREHDAFVKFSSSQTWRYWSRVISDPANDDGFIETGYEMLGLRTELDTGFDWGWRRIHESFNTSKKTELGARHSASRYKGKRFMLDFDGMTRAEGLAFAELLDSLDLDVTPVWIMLNQDDSDEGYFVNLLTNPAELRAPAVRIAGLEFEELSRGFKVRTA